MNRIESRVTLLNSTSRGQVVIFGKCSPNEGVLESRCHREAAKRLAVAIQLF
jgi:hypothetical protein